MTDVGGGHLKPFQLFHGSLGHGTIKYPKLEGTYKDHQVQILAAHRTTQKVDQGGESLPYHAPLGELSSSGSSES